MITIYVLRCVFVTVVLAVLLMMFPVSAETNSTQSLVAGETTFALDLYGQLKNSSGNLFFSPYSISTCLGMTYVGARGDTASQMAKVLHFKATPSDLPTPMGALENQLNAIRQKQGVELNTANGLWAQAGHPFLPAFLQTCQQQFGARLTQVDFRSQSEPARKDINHWVADQTKGKITDLIQRGFLNGSTRLVLVNAIYFKGRWTHPFDKSRTANAPFTIAPNQQIQAAFMHQEAMFKYAAPEGIQLLELPYVSSTNTEPSQPTPTPLNQRGSQALQTNDALSMIILLPKEADGLKQLESSLSESKLNEWLSEMHLRKVEVFLPKFKMTAEFSLGKTLEAMGMSAAFSPLADFSGMDGSRNLFISEVVHKAYVDVNEEGTEAAAATAVGIRASAVMRTPVFRADHPFIFLIRDIRSGCILFLGRMSDPTK